MASMLQPRSRTFKTLSPNDRTHLFALHADLTFGPNGGSVPSTRSRTRRNLLLVGVSPLGGVRPPPIPVSQPAPKRHRQLTPPVEVPPAPPSPPVAIPAPDGLPPLPVPDPVPAHMPPPVAGHQRGLAEEWELVNDDVVPATFVIEEGSAGFHELSGLGVPGAVGKTVFHNEAGCQVPVQFAHVAIVWLHTARRGFRIN